MIRCSGCSKSSLVKAACAEVAAEQSCEKSHAAVARSTFKSKCTKHLSFGAILQVPICKNGTPLWREAHFQVKMYKAPQVRSHFASADLQKWHAAVARSTFVLQNVQKHLRGGAILDVEICKIGTPLWREAHL